VRISSRGVRLSILSLSLAILYITYLDPLFAYLSILTSSIIAIDGIGLIARLRIAKSMRASPNKIFGRTISGSPLSWRIAIAPSLGSWAVLEDLPRWLKAEVDRGGGGIYVEILAHRRGVFRLDGLAIKIYSPLGLLYSTAVLDISIEVEVMPRAYRVLAEAIALLGSMISRGEAISRYRGGGLEYYWSRETVMGDDLRRIDWRATAKFQKIFVKEFHLEAEGFEGVIYDPRSEGEVSSDQLATIFLSAIASLARSGASFSLAILRPGHGWIVLRMLDPVSALAISIRAAMEEMRVDLWDVYELITPQPPKKILAKLSEILGSASEILEIASKELLKGAPAIARELLSNSGSWVLMISSPIIDTVWKLELISALRFSGIGSVVAVPSRPWLGARDLEEAYLIHQSYGKALEAFRRAGVSIVVGAEDLVKILPKLLPVRSKVS
jgi:hypothetical protein